MISNISAAMSPSLPPRKRAFLIFSLSYLMGTALLCLEMVRAAPLELDQDVDLVDPEKDTGNGEPVWSHGESYAFASATGEGAVLQTETWSEVDNFGGLHVYNITSDGEMIGHEVSGTTNCSQESTAYASGAWSANALAYGLCNSTVLLEEPVSNTAYGGKQTVLE